MPLISNLIEYSAAHALLINNKLLSPNFEHKNWGDEDLQEIRSTIRAFYRNEQIGQCAYCKNQVSLIAAGNAHIEHIVPKSIYPNFIFEPKNLCVVCCDCNQIKMNQEVLDDIPNTLNKNKILRYPRSSGAFRIVHPFFDDYDKHILIRRKIYIDLTDKGHFTIGACKLNRHFRQFGVEDNLLDDNELIGLMTDFMESKSSLKRARILEQLGEALP